MDDKEKSEVEQITDQGAIRKDDFGCSFFDNLEEFEDGYKIRLYKLTKSGTNTQREFVWEWENTEPSLTEIGTQFGSGKYEIYLHKIGVKGVFKRRVNVAKNFDILHQKYLENSGLLDQQQVSNTNHVPVVQQSSPTDSLKAGLSIVKEVMDVMKPMMEMNNKPQQQLQPDMMLSMTNKILEASTNNMLDMTRKVYRMTQDNLFGNDEPEEKEEFNVQSIVKSIAEYAPVLFNTPNAALAKMPEVKRINNDERARAILENKKKAYILIKELRKDGIPDDKIIKLCRLFKVRVEKLPKRDSDPAESNISNTGHVNTNQAESPEIKEADAEYEAVQPEEINEEQEVEIVQ